MPSGHLHDAHRPRPRPTRAGIRAGSQNVWSSRKNSVAVPHLGRPDETPISRHRTSSSRPVRSQTARPRCLTTLEQRTASKRPVFLVNKLQVGARTSFVRHARRIAAGVSRSMPHRRVNTQRSNRFVAKRPLNSMRLAVREKASRIRPLGRAVATPTPDHGDPGEGFGANEVLRRDRRLPGTEWLLFAGVGHGLFGRWNSLACGSCRPEACNGPGCLGSLPGTRLVDHPLEQTPHGDTPALCLGLDPGTPVVIEPDTDDGGLGGRHDLVNSNPRCLQQRRRTVAGRWWTPSAASLRVGSGRSGGRARSYRSLAGPCRRRHCTGGDTLDAPGLEARGTARGKALEDSDGMGASGSVTPRRPTLRTCSRRLACGPGTRFLGGLPTDLAAIGVAGVALSRRTS